MEYTLMHKRIPVADFSWFDPEALYGFPEEMANILSKAKRVDDNRSKKIADAVMARCEEIYGNKFRKNT